MTPEEKKAEEEKKLSALADDFEALELKFDDLLQRAR